MNQLSQQVEIVSLSSQWKQIIRWSEKESASNTKAKMQDGKHGLRQIFKTDNQGQEGITSSGITKWWSDVEFTLMKNSHINANKFNSL